MGKEDINRKISIWINDKEVKKSLGGIGREIGKIKRAIKESTDPAERARLNKELVKAKGHYADIKNEVEDTNVALDEAKGHFSTLFSGLMTGDFNQIQTGLKGIAGNIKGITKAGLAFIATPIGLAIAAFAGIAFATKEWIDFNLQVYETNKRIKELTQLSGEAVDAVRIRGEVLKDTFGIELETSVNSAKSLVNSFGISFDEAFDLIEQSAVKGKTKNEEFFASLKEYPIQFKNAGFSAQDFIKIVNTGIDLSIYQDKLPDAIKEAGLALAEQTDATKDALVNAFGAPFSNELLQKIESGEITTKQALQEIAKESDKVNLNQQQQAQLTADLFKGAGEDAGGSLKIFEALNIALNDQAEPLTKAQQLTQKQLDLNKELQGVYTRLFATGNEGMNKWIQRGKIFATETLIKILKGGVAVYNWFVDLNNQSVVFSGMLTGMGKAATGTFKLIGILLKAAGESFGSLATIIEGIFTLDPSKIEEGISKGFDVLPNAIKNMKNQVLADAGDIYDALQGKNKAKHINLNSFLADDSKSETTNTTTTTKSGSLTPEQQAKIEAYKKGEEEIDKLIEKKKAERAANQQKGLDKEIAKIEAAYTTLAEKYSGHKDKLAELEILKQQEITDLKLAKQKEFLDQANLIEEENRIAKEEAEFDREIERATTDEEKALLLLEKVQFLANEELRIEQEKELAKVEAVEGSEVLIAAIKEKYALKKEKSEASFTKGKEKADKNALANEKTLNNQRLRAYAYMFGGIAQLLGENTAAGKAAAIAQATMNTFLGITEVWKQPSVLPEPMATISRAVSTATVLASGLSAVKNITSTPTPSFFYGGHTGDTAVKYDQYGKVVGDVHENEWVGPAIMTQNPKYAANFAYLENERKRVTKGYYNGGTASSETSTPNIAFNDNAATETTTAPNIQLVNVLDRLTMVLENGIIAKTIIGYEQAEEINDLLTEIETSKQNGIVG